jgi:hypothetical protein
LQDIFQPTGNKVETTTVLLNALCEALMKGHTIEHIPTSKKDLEVGYMLLKLFTNNNEVLLAKTQHELLNMEGVVAFVQGTEDENNIALNKTDFVTHITKTVIDKVTLKDLVIRIPFPVKRLADRVKNINDCFVPGVHYTCTCSQCQYEECPRYGDLGYSIITRIYRLFNPPPPPPMLTEGR